MTLIRPGARPRLHLTATWEVWETPTTADIFLWDRMQAPVVLTPPRPGECSVWLGLRTFSDSLITELKMPGS